MRRMKSANPLQKGLSLAAMLLVMSGCTGVAVTPDGAGTMPSNPPASAPEATQPGATEVAPSEVEVDETPASDAPVNDVSPTEVPAEEAPVSDAPVSDAPQGAGMEVAERVNFDDGGNTAMLSGTLAADDDKQYALAMSAGQTLHVQIISPEAPINFTVYGPDGMSWTGELQPSEVYIFTNEFTVSTHGDYLVVLETTEIDAPNMPEVPAEAGYELVFTLNTAVSPGDPQVSPVDRISFDPQTNTTERSGMLATGPDSLQYLISARADQTLTVDATSDGTPLSMTIESPSGNQWIPEMRTTEDGYAIGHQVTLPEGGYYLVTLNKADHTPSTNYTVTFTLE